MPYILFRIRHSFFILLFFLLSGIALIGQPIDKDSMFLRGQYFYTEMAKGYYTESSEVLISYLEQAVSCFESAENWEYAIRCRNYLTGLYYKDENFVKFDEYALESFELAKKLLNKNTEGYATTLNNLSVSYKIKGDYSNALEKHFEAIDLISSNTKDKNLLVAVNYQNIGIIYKEIGDFEEAFRYLNKALALRLEIDDGNDANIPGGYKDLAQSLKQRGHIDSALVLYHLSLEKIKELKDLNDYTDQIKLHCLQGIAEVNLEQGKLNECLEYAQQAISFQEGKKQFDDYASHRILGDLFIKKGDIEKALVAYQAALTASQKEFEIYERHPTTAICQQNIGKAYLAKKNYNQALEWFQQALISNTLDFDKEEIASNPLSSQFINSKDAFHILEQKARTLSLRNASPQKQADDLRNAYACYLQASDVISTLRQSYLAEGSKHTLAAAALSVYEGAIQTALQLYESTEEKSYKEQAFLFAEANKAVVLQESMSGVEAMGKADIPQHLLDQEDSLRIEMTFYEQQINLARQKKNTAEYTDLKEWEQKAFELKKAYNDLIAFFEKDFPAYYDIKYNKAPLSIDHLTQNMSAAQSAIIEFFVGEENDYVFCLTGEGIQVHKIDRKKSLKTDILQLRQLLTNSPRSESFLEDFETFGQLSHQLYNSLLEPCIRELPSSVNRLCLIPDDILGYLPFELLLTKKAPGKELADYSPNTLEYLMEGYGISYNYSASLLLSNAKAKVEAATKDFLGMAPSFGKEIVGSERACSADQLYSLQCSGEEVRAINQLIGGEVLIDHQAEKAAFLERASDYRICHLATHACLDDRNPQLNRIYFSDDYLSSSELYNLQLNAELVVLSACNTGSGQMVKGEGVMSLSRGFIHAGCPSTLTSLWAVDDCATSAIMLGFYEAYTKGKRKDEALQETKIKYLANTTNKLYRHPYYWSAFIQLGNTDAASFYQAWWKNRLLWLAAILFLILSFWAFRRSGTT